MRLRNLFKAGLMLPMATVLFSIASMAEKVKYCPFERAIYGNIGSDYELTFPEAEVTEYPAIIRSVSAGLEFRGDVVWSNGAARPYISLSMQGKDFACGGEIHGLGVNRKGNIINEGLSSPGNPANSTILIQNLQACLYNQLKPDSFDMKLPQDIFYLARCKLHS